MIKIPRSNSNALPAVMTREVLQTTDRVYQNTYIMNHKRRSRRLSRGKYGWDNTMIPAMKVSGARISHTAKGFECEVGEASLPGSCNSPASKSAKIATPDLPDQRNATLQ